MTLPSILLGMILSSICGAVYHLVRGGGMSRLFLYLVLAGLGFWIGHFLDGYFGLRFFPIGPLNAGSALVVCVLFLIMGDWLGRIDITHKD